MPETVAAKEPIDLEQFIGSETIYRHWLCGVHFTEGVKYLAEKAGAFWLIDLIASHQLKPKVRAQEFQIWTLTVHPTPKKLFGKTIAARAECRWDTDSVVICAQNIEYTDFPVSMSPFKLYMVNKVIMLPSEY